MKMRSLPKRLFLTSLTGVCLIALLIAPKLSISQYCPAAGNAVCTSSISNVKFSTINRSGITADCVAAASYTYFSSDTAYLKPNPDTVYQVSVTMERYLDLRVIVWIDWNNDKIFDNAPGSNEVFPLVYSSAPVVGTFTYNGTVRIPAGITSLITRMRVRATGTPTPGPCDSDGWEVEDYVVKVTSEVVTPPTTAPTYCPATGNCGTANANAITRVRLTGDGGTSINNVTACDNYGDYTQLRATVTAGNSYVVEVSGGNNALGLGGIFIDWNNNGTLDDPGESYSAANAQPFTFAIVPPTTATSGLKRMRVRTCALASTPLPCGNQNLGEVEDYTLFFNNPNAPLPACSDTSKVFPKRQSVDNCQKITFRWNRTTGATGYKFSLLQGTTFVVKEFSTTDTSYVPVSPLTVSTTYKWIVVPMNANGSAVGCDTITFTTSPNLDPIADIQPDGDQTVCQGNPLSLNGNPSQGTAPYSHVWTAPNQNLLTSFGTVNPDFVSTEPVGIYSLSYTVKDANNCASTDSVKVTIEPNSITGTLSAVPGFICEGESSSLILDGHKGNITWESSASASGPWVAANLTPINDSTFSTGTLGITTYFRAVVTLGSCANTSSSIAVNVTPLPLKPVILSSGNTACEGDVVTLRVTNYSTGILWDDENVTSNSELLVTKSGTYTATIGGACESKSDPITVTFNPTPTKPVVTVQGNNPACEGEQLVLSSSYSSGNNWSNGAVTASITVVASGTYTVTQKNSFDCAATSNAVVVTINPRPSTPILTVLNQGTICEGDLVKITSNYSGVSWSTGSTTDTITVTTSGTYSVSYTDNNGCSASSSPYVLTMSPLPTKPVVSAGSPFCKGSSGLLTSTESGFKTWNNGDNGNDISITMPGSYSVTIVDNNGCSSTSNPFAVTFDDIPATPKITQVGNDLIADVIADSYQWLDVNGPILGATAKIYTPLHSGNHFVIALSPQGCESASSDSIFFSGVGLFETVNLKQLALHPNPNAGTFNIDLGTISADKFEVFDLAGKMVAKGRLSEGQNTITLHLAPGVYQLQVLKGPETKGIQRLLIQ